MNVDPAAELTASLARWAMWAAAILFSLGSVAVGLAVILSDEPETRNKLLLVLISSVVAAAIAISRLRHAGGRSKGSRVD